MAKDKEQPVSIVEMLAKATVDDLKSLDEQIEAKEKEVEEVTRKATAELDSLKAMRRVIDIKLNGKPQRQPRQKKSGKDGESIAKGGLGERVYQLVRQDGPQPIAVLARQLEVSDMQIKMAIGHHVRLRLLPEGRVAVKTI